jgi:trans-aconitate 2-methyltransferase
MWDPQEYLRFADTRSRAFFELLARVGATSPRYVLDLGCGPGHLTTALAKRWPEAEILGVDSSEEMIEAARAELARSGDGAGSVRFEVADLRDFKPARSPDVIIANAVLHWIPDHRDALLPEWVGMLAPGGWLAIQMPADGDQIQILNDVLKEIRAASTWRERLRQVPEMHLDYHPGDYVDLFARAGCEVDAWESTYLHVFQGDNPVLEWFKGTAFRPIIAALEPAQTAEFFQEAGSRLRAAYPARSYGTVLPTRRVFAVAQKRG